MAKFKEGTKLLIEMIEGESYEGTFSYGDDYRLTLYNVSEYPSGVKDEGYQYFYKTEIASISVINSTYPEEPEKQPTITTTTTPTISLIEDKFKELQELANKFIYIAVVDNQFLNAIKFLHTCTEIAVFGLGSLFGRNAKIALLTVATKHQVYIFDIKLSQCNRAFDMGLKELLESMDVRKIVHDSKTLGDCLLHGHKTVMKNVFDAQVADFLLRKKLDDKVPDKMRTFPECVHDYLNIPVRVVTNLEMNLKQLLERPLSNERKRNSALYVSYLYVLKDVLEKKMLEDFYRTTNLYMDCMRNEEPVIARKMLTYDVPDLIKKIE